MKDVEVLLTFDTVSIIEHECDCGARMARMYLGSVQIEDLT